MSNWTGCQLFPSRWEQRLYKFRFIERSMLARRGVQFVPIWIPYISWKTFPQKKAPRKLCLPETQTSLWCLQSTCFWGQSALSLLLSFDDPDVVTELSRLHENFTIVPADKASNNYTFVCKKYYVDILIEKLGLHLLNGNPTYNVTDFSASEVLDNHKSVLNSFGIPTNDEELDLPYIYRYWIPQMHKNPYKHRFITDSSKWSIQPLSVLHTKLPIHIKQGLQKYCETAYSRSGTSKIEVPRDVRNSKGP